VTEGFFTNETQKPDFHSLLVREHFHEIQGPLLGRVETLNSLEVNVKVCRSVVMDADGAVSVSKEETRAAERHSKLPEIIEKLKDPNYQPAELMRLIAIQMLLLIMGTKLCRNETELQACARERKALDAARRIHLSRSQP
jgi:hypothetical protein